MAPVSGDRRQVARVYGEIAAGGHGAAVDPEAVQGIIPREGELAVAGTSIYGAVSVNRDLLVARTGVYDIVAIRADEVGVAEGEAVARADRRRDRVVPGAVNGLIVKPPRAADYDIVRALLHRKQSAAAHKGYAGQLRIHGARLAAAVVGDVPRIARNQVGSAIAVEVRARRVRFVRTARATRSRHRQWRLPRR